MCLLFPLIAAAQGTCNSMPDDAAMLECLQKRQVLLEKTRSAKSEQLKSCIRYRLEDAPEGHLKGDKLGKQVTITDNGQCSAFMGASCEWDGQTAKKVPDRRR
ncbi:hypothetical protein PV762_05985 [Mitsuaria sp. CC2]|uniref:hypothetical protein n=1 Tax=Mitsuaria sp. CC2 TaxID=3029186 RepID=UPI003B8B4CDA